MALSREDKADVKGALGKALANKVSDATRDFGKGKILYKSKGFDAAESNWNKKRGNLDKYAGKKRLINYSRLKRDKEHYEQEEARREREAENPRTRFKSK